MYLDYTTDRYVSDCLFEFLLLAYSILPAEAYMAAYRSSVSFDMQTPLGPHECMKVSLSSVIPTCPIPPLLPVKNTRSAV